jgi:Putative glycolipid-binding
MEPRPRSRDPRPGPSTAASSPAQPGPRTARITARTAQGRARPLLESDNATRWLVDGDPAAHLDGCLEADLELSALTNAVPVHRLGLPVGSRPAMPTPAGWFGHASPGWGVRW